MIRVLVTLWAIVLLPAFFFAGTFAISFAFGSPYDPADEIRGFWNSLGAAPRAVFIFIAVSFVLYCFQRPLAPPMTLEIPPKPKTIGPIVVIVWFLASALGLLAAATFFIGVLRETDW